MLFSLGYPAGASAIERELLIRSMKQNWNFRRDGGVKSEEKYHEKGMNICGTAIIKRPYLSLSHIYCFLFLLGQVGR